MCSLQTRWGVLLLFTSLLFVSGTLSFQFAVDPVTNYGFALFDENYNSWYEARKKCRNMSDIADLAVFINDSEVLTVDSNLFAAATLESYWIGIYDEASEQNFKILSTGQPLAVTNWDSGRPGFDSNKNCGGIKSANSKWRDEKCFNPSKFRGVLCKVLVQIPSSGLDPNTGCPPGMVPFDGLCYDFTLLKLGNFTESRDICESIPGGRMIVPDSNTADFLQLYALLSGIPQFWLGISDEYIDDDFRSVDGAPLSYVNWFSGSPSATPLHTDCVYMDAQDGMWSTDFCEEPGKGIMCVIDPALFTGFVAETTTAGDVTSAETTTGDVTSAETTTGDVTSAETTTVAADTTVSTTPQQITTYGSTQSTMSTLGNDMCSYPLGLSSPATLTNISITASSENPSYPSASARLGHGTTGWKPQASPTASPDPWIEVTFGGPTRLVKIATQAPQVLPLPPPPPPLEFNLLLWTKEGRWIQHPLIFSSNFTEADEVLYLFLNRSLLTTKIRLIVFQGADIGLRLEFYGCPSLPGTECVLPEDCDRDCDQCICTLHASTLLSDGPPYICKECWFPLGLESNDILDSQISASSDKYTGRKTQVRLGSPGAWSSSQSDVDPWITVTFAEPMVVTGIITQGEVYNMVLIPDDHDFIRGARIEYGNSDSIFNITEFGETKIFKFNTDATEIVTHIFPYPVHTNFITIRVVEPVAPSDDVGFRMELLGCNQTTTGNQATTTVTATTAATTTAATTTAAETTAAETTAADTTIATAPTTAAPTAAPTAASTAEITTLPSTTLPSTTAPSTTAPSTTLPSTTLPSTTAPSTTTPSNTAPSTFAPPTTSPSTIAPSTTSPSNTSPSNTSPSNTAPSTTAPSTAASTTAPSTAASTNAPSTTAPSTTSPSTTAPSTTAASTTAIATTTTYRPTTDQPTTLSSTSRPVSVCGLSAGVFEASASEVHLNYQDTAALCSALNGSLSDRPSHDVTDAGMTVLLQATANVSNNPLGPSDLVASVRFLESVANTEFDVADSDRIVRTLEDMVNVGSNLLSTAQVDSWKDAEERQELTGPFQIINSLEEVMRKVGQSLATNSTVEITTENIGIHLDEVTANELILSGWRWSTLDSKYSAEVTAQEFRNRNFSAYDRALLAGGVFRNVALLSSDEQPANETTANLQRQVQSDIVTVIASTDKKVSVSVTYETSNDFVKSVVVQPDQLQNFSCVFWEDDLSGATPGGGSRWSEFGCQVVASRDDNGGGITCFCNHTTNFAVLMQVVEKPTTSSDIHEFVLQIVTYICLTVSIISLVISLTLFMVIGSSLPSERLTIHRNLMTALLLALILFLLGVASNLSTIPCKIVAILLHYLFLTVFSWILIEGVHLYRLVIAVFDQGGSKMPLYYVVGWGLPAVIVGVSLAVKYKLYGTGAHCWLTAKDGLIWAFVGPVILIITVNMVVLIMVVVVVTRAAALKCQTNLERIRAACKSALMLVPLLGISWILGLFTQYSIVLEYAFVILNTLQGFFMFFFYCLMSSEVRTALRLELKKRADRNMDGSRSQTIKTNVWSLSERNSNVRLGKVGPSSDSA